MIGLRVTDGTTTVVLSDGDAYVKAFVPKTPEANRIEQAQFGMDGGEVPVAVWRNVTEPAEIAWVTGNAAARAAINNLTKLFTQARAFQRSGLGSRAWVEFSPDASETYYRSEILDGQVVLAEEALDWQWTGELIQAQVTWVRRYFWEGPDTQVPLTNGNATDDLAGLTIYNHDDAGAGHDNYAHIGASAVAGDLPAPPRIEIYNSYNNADRLANVWIAHNVRSSPATFPTVLEAEAATEATPIVDAASSGGNYASVDLAAGSDQKAASWALSTALLNACAGNYVRLLLYRKAPADAMWMRAKVKVSTTTLWTGPRVYLDGFGGIEDLGAVQLPPYLVGSGDLYPLTLELDTSIAAPDTLYFDYLYLLPIDGWRKLAEKGYGCIYQATLVDDMIDDTLYVQWTGGSAKLGNYIAYGSPIMLQPGAAQRLYFVMDGETGAPATARTAAVKVYYRPRRLTL